LKKDISLLCLNGSSVEKISGHKERKNLSFQEQKERKSTT
jgi:hypothetical protein